MCLNDVKQYSLPLLEIAKTMSLQRPASFA